MKNIYLGLILCGIAGGLGAHFGGVGGVVAVVVGEIGYMFYLE